MNVSCFTNNNPLHEANPLQAAQEWRDLLVNTIGQAEGRHYIVIGDDREYQMIPASDAVQKPQRIPIPTIVEISHRKFEDLKNSLIAMPYITEGQVREFRNLSLQIAGYTEALITLREEKRDENKVVKIGDVVIPFLPGLITQVKQLKENWHKDKDRFQTEIADLKANVLAIREEIKEVQEKKDEFDSNLLKYRFGYSENLSGRILHLGHEIPELGFFETIDRIHELNVKIKELKRGSFPKNLVPKLKLLIQQRGAQMEEEARKIRLYVNDMAINKEKFGFNDNQAARFLLLKQDVHDTLMPQLNSEAYAAQILDIIQSTFREQLDAHQSLPLEERPPVIGQFEKDIPRQASFQRTDSYRQIVDIESQPSAESPVEKKVEEAQKALGALTSSEGDQDWEFVLQLAVTQTNLNGAFFLPVAQLAQLGSQLTWNENGHEYALVPVFPIGGRPPAKLEIIRDENDLIISVNVTIEGSLDLIKKLANSREHLPEDIVISGAIQTELSYTLTLDADRKPVISNFSSVSTTTLPPVGEPFQAIRK